MGKTALLDVAESMSGERGIRVFRGTGDAAAQVIPFGPLLEALASGHDAPVPQPRCATSASPLTNGSGCCVSCRNHWNAPRCERPC